MSSEHSKRPSATKSGPGRYHSAGATKASPIKSKGAPRGFVLHAASEAKRDRRAIVRAVGVRQHKKDIRANRLAALAGEAA